MIQQFLKFNPILKEKIWGGNKLIKLLNKKSDKNNIGESWEISDVNGAVSVVKNGTLKGKTLRELVSKYQSDFVGGKVYRQFGKEFPLLIKFIDAKEKLSIQLHPDDELSKKRHNSYGKTEMWYIMESEPKSKIIVGFKKDSNKEEYLHHLENKTLTKILNKDKVLEGDVYFIPTGRVHAIGAGVMLAEIQQTSDNTYRVYDWDRKDTNGNYRELHTDLALEAIDFKAQDTYKTVYSSKRNESSEVVSCPFFTTNIITLDSNIIVNHQQKDSFVIYMCVAGKVNFVGENESESLQVGETLLIPACFKSFKIQSNKTAKILEVYIK